MPFHRHFELDIVSALRDQLISAFDDLDPGYLNEKNIRSVPEVAGVYQLYYLHSLVYVGKTESLRKRLQEHHEKISGRRKLKLTDVEFTCLSVRSNIHAVSESSLIRHYKSVPGACAWNGNGFGPHDPGRERETTNKPPDGFDSQFPIREDWPCKSISEEKWKCGDLLLAMKVHLPFLLRYQVSQKNRLKDGHPDYKDVTILVPHASMPADALLKLITQHLPGWQATRFPSHFILYKEQRLYKHGITIWPA
ncbi:MAG: Eco29kI family restriction endonuclease [Terriglobia bacterium]